MKSAEHIRFNYLNFCAVVDPMNSRMPGLLQKRRSDTGLFAQTPLEQVWKSPVLLVISLF